MMDNENNVAITTGDQLFAECQVVWRVLFFGHSAKTPLPSVFFDTRQRSSLPSVFLTLGKQASLPSVFFDTRQRASLPSVIFLTLDKENFKAHFEAVN